MVERNQDTKMLSKENGQKTGAGGVFSILPLTLSIAMLAVGVHYQNPDDEMKKNCEFGATLYLFIGGILGIIVHGLGVITAIATWCAERDGVVTEGEKCGLNFLKSVGGCAATFVFNGELGILVWGSVVVFGPYAEWTDDVAKRNIPNDGMEYCNYTPFMFAFVLLIIRWALIALVPVVICCCAPLICLGLGLAINSSKEETANSGA